LDFLKLSFVYVSNETFKIVNYTGTEKIATTNALASNPRCQRNTFCSTGTCCCFPDDDDDPRKSANMAADGVTDFGFGSFPEFLSDAAGDENGSCWRRRYKNF